MQIAARNIMLFAAIGLGSFALGAVTTARTSPVPAAASRAVQALPVGSGDPSVPLASTVVFPADEGMAAPTF